MDGSLGVGVRPLVDLLKLVALKQILSRFHHRMAFPGKFQIFYRFLLSLVDESYLAVVVMDHCFLHCLLKVLVFCPLVALPILLGCVDVTALKHYLWKEIKLYY